MIHRNAIYASNVAAKAKPPAGPDSELEDPRRRSGYGCPGGAERRQRQPLRYRRLGDLDRHAQRRVVGVAMARHYFDRGVARVERSVEETKAGLRLKQPKTRAGRRNIALAPDTAAALAGQP